MRSCFILLLISFMVINTTIAQEATTTKTNQESLLVDSKWRINIFPLTVGYEHRITPKSTIYTELGLNTNRYSNLTDSSATWRERFFNRTTLGVGINARVAYRYFYNIEKRYDKQKNIAFNSANYIGGQVTSILPPIIKFNSDEIIGETGVLLGGIWGMQRVQRGGRLVFNLEVGPALRITNDGTSPDFITNITLGFILGDKTPNL